MRQITKVEHMWCKEHDRWIYIERYYGTSFIGLNYCQGNEYELFKDEFCYIDQGLSTFYESLLKSEFNHKGSVYSEINDAMWLYHSALDAIMECPNTEVRKVYK